MKTSLFLSAVSLPLGIIPDQLHSSIVARASNYFLRGQAIGDRLHALEGKKLSIRITDIPVDLRFTIRDSKLHRTVTGEWDVRISGELVSFWLLATRAEDPDTLFFNRRLNIEGDTETGLHVKNILDALEFDWQAHFADVVGRQPPEPMLRFLNHIKAVFRKRRLHG